MNTKILKKQSEIDKNYEKATAYAKQMSKAKVVTGVDKTIAVYTDSMYYRKTWKGQKVMTEKQFNKAKQKGLIYNDVYTLEKT